MSKEIAGIQPQKPLTLNVPGVATLLDSYAKTYGLGMQGQWGKCSGAESLMHHAFENYEKESITIEHFRELVSSAMMVYDPSMGSEPPKKLNAALKDILSKMDTLEAMNKKNATSA